MNELLRQLLALLHEIGERHEELYDSEVAERMTAAIHDGFLKPVRGFALPDDFGLYSSEANMQVKSALRAFIEPSAQLADDSGMSFHERLRAFQNLGVSFGNQSLVYNDFFRYTPPERYDANGNPLPR